MAPDDGRSLPFQMHSALDAAKGPVGCAEGKEIFQGKAAISPGKAIRFTNFDVKLGGRLLAAQTALHRPSTGIVELIGKVKLKFARTRRNFRAR